MAEFDDVLTNFDSLLGTAAFANRMFEDNVTNTIQRTGSLLHDYSGGFLIFTPSNTERSCFHDFVVYIPRPNVLSHTISPKLRCLSETPFLCLDHPRVYLPPTAVE